MKPIYKTAIALAVALSLAQGFPPVEATRLEWTWRADSPATQSLATKSPQYTRGEFAQAIGSAIRGTHQSQ